CSANQTTLVSPDGSAAGETHGSIGTTTRTSERTTRRESFMRRIVPKQAQAASGNLWAAKRGSIGRQRHADDFLIVSRVDAFIRESRVRPNDRATGITVDRIEQMRAAQFLVFLRAEFRND